MPGFDEDSARRIANAVRRMEATAVNSLPDYRGPAITEPARYATVTTTITAAVRATNTLGKGIGTLYLTSYSSSDVATYDTMLADIPLYSGALSTIASGRVVLVMLVDGRYHVVADYC